MDQPPTYEFPRGADCLGLRRRDAAARRSRPTRHSARTVLATVFAWFPVAAAVSGAGCAEPLEYAYRGTGALQATGSPSPTMASSTVVLGVCPGDVQTDPPTLTFSVLTIGEACTLAGWGGLESFRAPLGSLCTLPFEEGMRTLRVTDVVAHYGLSGADRTYVDSSYVDLALGGDDTKSGQHALYHFTGRLMGQSVPPEARRCAELRKKMQGEARTAG
jgi:hypothetical protein